MRAFIIFIAPLLLLTSALKAQDYERVVKKSFKTTSAPAIIIDSRFGSVNVQPHGATIESGRRSGDKSTLHVYPDGPDAVNVVVKVRVDANSEQEAKRIAEAARVEIKEKGNSVSVRTGLPPDMDDDDGEHRNITIDVQVTAPSKSHLDLESKFGDVTILGITGSVKAQSGFGTLELQKCANIRVYNSFGDVTLAGIRGETQAQVKMGRLIAHHIEGGRFASSYGDMELSEVSGFLDIESSMGSVEVIGMRSGKINSSYGSIEVTLNKKFSGEIRAEASFGSIDSDFDLKEKGKKGPGDMGEKKYGKIGNGKDKIALSSSFGSISIEEE
ncbi:DUF4097 domain-containing protein [bacterium]|nr:DUF4097 domain-containing protein [bacterium]